ncbi:MAG: hypothetical protein ACD_70C00185G0002 [uncultured bacterium]|nr:MAG: hypothetical protein ACD_70C00185G0002 [uncultured bacterium]
MQSIDESYAGNKIKQSEAMSTHSQSLETLSTETREKNVNKLKNNALTNRA